MLRSLSGTQPGPFLYESTGVSHPNAMGMHREAAESFGYTIEINPWNALFLNSRGICLRRIGEDRGAEECFTRAWMLPRLHELLDLA